MVLVGPIRRAMIPKMRKIFLRDATWRSFVHVFFTLSKSFLSGTLFIIIAKRCLDIVGHWNFQLKIDLVLPQNQVKRMVLIARLMESLEETGSSKILYLQEKGWTKPLLRKVSTSLPLKTLLRILISNNKWILLIISLKISALEELLLKTNTRFLWVSVLILLHWLVIELQLQS